MANTREGWHTLPDGRELYTKSWIPSSPPSAVIIFIHGFSDHCNRYADFFPNLAARNILVHSFDQRGWGRSVKKSSEKGLTGPTSQVLGDITSFIKSHLPSPAPLFLMGHSMGGQETLQYAAVGPEDVRKQISGFLVTAPFIRLHTSSMPSQFTLFAGRMAAKVLPRRQLVNKLQSHWMCHDEVMNKSWDDDELCHNTGTLEGLADLFTRAEGLDSGAVMIQDSPGTHVWIGHGTEDHICSYDATKQYVGRLKFKDLTFESYDGSYHCVHLEPTDKAKMTEDVSTWILARAKSSSQHQEGSGEIQSKL